MPAATGAPPLVSVLLVTYNSAPDLPACLEALGGQRLSGGFEVIAVDNASTDDSADLLDAWTHSVRRRRLPVRVVRNDANVGYAAANNQAAALATGPILLLLNPDAAMDEGCLQRLVDHLATGTGVGAASALLRNPDGTIQRFARRELQLGDVVWDLTDLGAWVDQRFRAGRGRAARRYAAAFAGLDGEDPAAAAPFAVDCPAAACVALWRDLAKPLLFDERFPLFFNDGDLFGRVRGQQYRCEVVPAAGAVHGYGSSHRRIAQARKRAEFVASLRAYVRLRHPLRLAAAVDAALLVDAVLGLLAGVVARNRSRLDRARGTWGGFWLPGGYAPWLLRRPSRRSQVGAMLRRWQGALHRAAQQRARSRAHRRARREIRRLDRLYGSRTTVRIDRRARVGRLLYEVRPGSRSSIDIGPQAMVADSVLLRLWGGELVIGPAAQVRHGVTLTVKGRMVIEPRVAIGRGAQIHADGTMHVRFGAGVAERATIIDTRHTHDDVPLSVLDKPIDQADIEIGEFCFVGANAVIVPGVTVGRCAVVAAQSVATRDVPVATMVAGAPAQPVRRVHSVLTAKATRR